MAELLTAGKKLKVIVDGGEASGTTHFWKRYVVWKRYCKDLKFGTGKWLTQVQSV